jgi:hypothetical protein
MARPLNSSGTRKPRPRPALALVLGMGALIAVPLVVSAALRTRSQLTVHDPGIRGGPPDAGGPIPGLNSQETTTFNDGSTNFTTVFAVPQGLGPRFDENQCSSCHVQPAVGGSGPAAPATNPLFNVYTLDGATNSMPSFETMTGPILVPRFPYMADLKTPDGTVHQLFTITGRSDASGCNIQQPNFSQAQSEGNLAYHQPLPTFGDGLLEFIENSALTANMSTVNRLGWKAQWRGLNLATGEELNVQQGVTNEYFPAELDQTTGCDFNPVPESATNFNPNIAEDQFTGDPERMAIFMRFLAPPTPAQFNSHATNGQTQFSAVGCQLCHTVSFTTPSSPFTFMSQKTINPYSDLLLHHMGPCLADNVIAGMAQGDMFRTPPLWGAGKRMFFLHDGRTSDLLAAIQDHFCVGNSQYPASEANTVIDSFNALSPQNQQDLLYFLRDL